MGANPFASNFGLIKDVLEQGIRKATITILWKEHGLEKSIVVSLFLTDPRRVDQSIAMPSMPPGMGGGGGKCTTSAECGAGQTCSGGVCK